MGTQGVPIKSIEVTPFHKETTQHTRAGGLHQCAALCATCHQAVFLRRLCWKGETKPVVGLQRHPLIYAV